MNLKKDVFKVLANVKPKQSFLRKNYYLNSLRSKSSGFFRINFIAWIFIKCLEKDAADKKEEENVTGKK
jgi:hypothetical protein